MKKERLIEILSEFKKRTVAVVGDLMLDEYIIGKVSRISPEAPVPVVNVESESFVLGGAANVINNLYSLGSKVISFGVIGQDANGKKLKDELEKRGVNTEGIIEDRDRPTIVKQRVIAHNQQLLRMDWEKKRPIVTYIEDQILNTLKIKIEDIDAIILSDYDKGVLTERLAKEIIKIANSKNKTVIVDPKPSNSLNYIGATSMTPNMKEAAECVGAGDVESEEEVIKLGEEIKSKLSLTNLLLTRSEKGMSIFEDGKVRNIPTVAREVYDVTGAGDTVISVYTLASVSGASYYESAKIANSAAGIVVGRIGTSIVTKDEIIEFYEELYHEG